ncbi:MAG TPA: adenylate/guanylate cyclase domain-containing protein [Solirubrobacteraceae bacterium]
MSTAPRTRYAQSAEASIAYQVSGEGPIDLVTINGPASHLEVMWEEPGTARSFRKLASFSRLIQFDRRGTGLSDAVSSPPTLEQQMDDLQAVLAAVGSERTAVLGASDLGLSAMFAATYPDQVTALVLQGVAAEGQHTLGGEAHELMRAAIDGKWGDGTLVELYAPSQLGNRAFVDWWGRMQRSAVSPGMARQLMEMTAATRLRALLPTIRVPTLVVHASGDRLVPVKYGREVASLIPGARFIEYPSEDAYGWADAQGLDYIEEFLTGKRSVPETDRVLATVLFTDIVGSTERLAELGDGRWRAKLDEHNHVVRSELDRWRGREIKNSGDGFFATFDGPARGLRCAAGIVERVADVGLSVRAGLHTGECELLPDDVAGMAVHIGARVMDQAGPGEVLVSSTVKELVVGSGLRFVDRGMQALKGVPDPWHLYALEG